MISCEHYNLNSIKKLGLRIRTFATVSVCVGLGLSSLPAETSVHSRPSWDKNLLGFEFQDVRIKTNEMWAALREIQCKYLLRLNVYLDLPPNPNVPAFAFAKPRATGKDLLQAFLSAYPTLTYTQDATLGIIWIHPKNINYSDILNQRVKVARDIHQASAYDGVIRPLCDLFAAEMSVHPEWAFHGANASFNYGVDIPAGVYEVKQILNFCCIANPTKAFRVSPGPSGKLLLIPTSLDYENSLAPLRIAALRFWESEIGKTTNGIPTADQVAMALADSSPKVRWAARAYLEAAGRNYSWNDLIGDGTDPERAIWTALGIEAATFQGINNERFLLTRGPAVTNNFGRLQNPGLALLLCLELAREQQNTDRLEGVFRNHSFSSNEVASIKPDVYRMFHASEHTREKLKKLKLEVPEFSAEALREIGKVNPFTSVSRGSN